MAFQNRVLPTGEIVADTARGLFTGNRGGTIHDPVLKILLPTRRWASKAWICCVTRFRDRKREVMGPGYTNLFFLDEVTALSAGHRPCYECRRADAQRFAAAWQRAFGLAAAPRAGEMDAVLHRQRLAGADGGHPSEIASLPDGAVFLAGPEGQGAGRSIWVVRGADLVPWTPSGYGAAIPRPETGTVAGVTPPAVLAVYAAGYEPVWHPSAPDGK